MKMLNLEFVQRRAIPWAALAFLIFAGIVGLHSLMTLRDIRDENQRLRSLAAGIRITLQRQDEAAARPNVAQNEASKARMAEEQRIIEALRYPWNRLFATLEQSGDADVAVISFSHTQKNSDTSLILESRDVAGIVHFVANLNDGDESESRWYLAGYQRQTTPTGTTVNGVVRER